MKIRRSVFLSLPVFGALGLVTFSMAGPPSTWLQSTSLEEQHVATAPERESRSRHRAALEAQVIEFGLESGKCGFHIIEPPRDISPLNADMSDGANRRYWNWWDAIPGYPEEHLLPMGPDPVAYPPRPLPSVLVSIERIAPNTVASLSMTQTASGWDLHATFDVGGLTLLEIVHGPTTSNVDYIDWYGDFHLGGGPSSRMDAALVVNGVALLSFSITDLIDQSAPQVVTVARDLTFAEANYVMNAYGQ